MPSFLGRYHGMDLRQANIMAFVLGAVGVAGLLGGGWAADRVSRVRPNGRMLLAASRSSSQLRSSISRSSSPGVFWLASWHRWVWGGC